jgi:predicted PurR-regulated permease PerM
LPKVKPKLATPPPLSSVPGSRPTDAKARRPQRTLQIGFAISSLLLALMVVYLIRNVIGAFVLGTMLAFLIIPAVDWLGEHRVPRAFAILGIFALLIALAVAVVSLFVPLLAAEVEQLREAAPGIASTAQEQLSHLQGHPVNFFGLQLDLAGTTERLDRQYKEFLLGQFGTALTLGIAALSTLFQVILMLIVAFLISLDAHAISSVVRRLMPVEYRSDFDSIWADIKSMLLAYFRGQLIIGTMIGAAIGVAAWFLGLQYALALGLLAGLTSLVPYLGPFLGAVPAILVGLAVNPVKAIVVAIVYLVICNVILNFVYPKVVGDAVRLPPILVIMAFIAGFSLAGILGMFVAVPIAATIRILFDYLYPRLYGI